jgi:hypothetical protein
MDCFDPFQFIAMYGGHDSKPWPWLRTTEQSNWDRNRTAIRQMGNNQMKTLTTVGLIT